MYYGPDQLAAPDSTLSIVAECLDELVAVSKIGRSYSGNTITNSETYDRTFTEQIGDLPIGKLNVRLEVICERFAPTAPLRECVQAAVSYETADGHFVSVSEYELRKYAGNIASLKIRQSLDGLATAMAHDDISFTRFVGRRDGTEYDATQLFDEIATLHSLQEEDGATIAPVDSAARWYD